MGAENGVSKPADVPLARSTGSAAGNQVSPAPLFSRWDLCPVVAGARRWPPASPVLLRRAVVKGSLGSLCPLSPSPPPPRATPTLRGCPATSPCPRPCPFSSPACGTLVSAPEPPCSAGGKRGPCPRAPPASRPRSAVGERSRPNGVAPRKPAAGPGAAPVTERVTGSPRGPTRPHQRLTPPLPGLRVKRGRGGGTRRVSAEETGCGGARPATGGGGASPTPPPPRPSHLPRGSGSGGGTDGRLGSSPPCRLRPRAAEGAGRARPRADADGGARAGGGRSRLRFAAAGRPPPGLARRRRGGRERAPGGRVGAAAAAAIPPVRLLLPPREGP